MRKTCPVQYEEHICLCTESSKINFRTNSLWNWWRGSFIINEANKAAEIIQSNRETHKLIAATIETFKQVTQHTNESMTETSEKLVTVTIWRETLPNLKWTNSLK